MTKHQKLQTSIFSLRLTVDERKRLEKLAAGMPLGEYFRYCALADNRNPRHTRNQFPIKDHKLIAQILSALGRTRMANNLNQIARAANCGALMLDPETLTNLNEACNEIHEMRNTLIKSVGLDA